MEELVKIFGKYFPKDFSNLEIIKKEIYLENKDLNLDFEENKLNLFKIHINGSSKINLDLLKLKNHLIHICFILSENSDLFVNIKGKILGKSCLAIEVLSNKNSRVKILEKIIVLGEHTNISKLFVPRGFSNSELILNQYFMLFENGKLINLPILNIEEKICKVKHSSKKIRLNEDQVFYLEAKNLSKEKIINLLERSFIEV